jgi:hypothetical protein
MLVWNWAVALALLMSLETARGNTNTDLLDNAKPFRPPNDDFDRFTLFNSPLQQYEHETKAGLVHDERDYIHRWDEELQAYEVENNRYLREKLWSMYEELKPWNKAKENHVTIDDLRAIRVEALNTLRSLDLPWNEAKENDAEIDDLRATRMEILNTIRCLERGSWQVYFRQERLVRELCLEYGICTDAESEPDFYEKVLNEHIALADFVPGPAGRFYSPPPENKMMRSLISESENSETSIDTNSSLFQKSSTKALTVAAVTSGLIAWAWYKLSRKKKLEKRSWSSAPRSRRRHQRQWDVDRS